MLEFSFRSEVKKRRRLLWAVFLAAVVLAVAVVWLVSAGKRAIISRIAAAVRETSLGKLEFRDIETTGQGLTFIEPRLKHPETGRLVAEAERVALGVTAWDILRSRGDIASVTVTIDGLRVYPEYTGDGHWDLEELLREAPERELGELRELALVLRNAKVEVRLDPGQRLDLAAYIDKLIEPSRKQLQARLGAALPSGGSVGLTPALRGDLDELLAQASLVVPPELSLAFSGRLNFGLSARSALGDFAFSSPLAGAASFEWRGEKDSGEVQLTTTRLALGSLGFLASITSYWDLDATTVEDLGLRMAIEPKFQLRLASTKGRLSNLRLFPGRAHELTLMKGDLSVE